MVRTFDRQTLVLSSLYIDTACGQTHFCTSESLKQLSKRLHKYSVSIMQSKRDLPLAVVTNNDCLIERNDIHLSWNIYALCIKLFYTYTLNIKTTITFARWMPNNPVALIKHDVQSNRLTLKHFAASSRRLKIKLITIAKTCRCV